MKHLAIFVVLLYACTAPTQPPQPQVLLNEGFTIGAGKYDFYSWNVYRTGTLNVTVNADSDIYIYVVDEPNFWKYKAGETFNVLANRDKITFSNFEVEIPSKGKYYIFISNTHSVLTTKNVSLKVLYTPRSY